MTKTIEELTGPINEGLRRLGIEQASAILSEGFCPLCSGRSSDIPIDDFSDEENTRTVSATVHCQRCHIRWRCGPNPESELDWIEHTILVYDNARLSTTLNPPPEPQEEDYDEWELDT